MTSWLQRCAAFEALKAVERPGGGWPNGVVAQIAGEYGVGASTLRRWAATGVPDRGTSTAFTPSMDDYVGVAESLDIKAAWRKRYKAHQIDVEYSTYHRALAHGDKGLYEAALRGADALINHRLYLEGTPLHRNHTWSYDHSELPIWVTLPRHRDPVKPWITMVTDTFSRALLALVLIVGRPTAETVAAALVEAAVGREYDDEFIGGLPVQMRFDSAAEHLGEIVAAGATRMGIVATPSNPYSKWENGQAESKIGLIKREALAGLPAVTMGGFNHSNKPRFDPGQAQWWPIDRLARHLDAFRDQWNVQRTQGVLQNRTPMQVWVSDDTDIRTIDEARMVANMLKKGVCQNVNKQGVNFRGINYLPVDRNGWMGRKVWVRYLERNHSFIAVSLDRDFNDFVFAYPAKKVTPEQRKVMLQQRAAQRDYAAQVDAEATRRRAHGDAVENTRMTSSDDPDEIDGPDDPSETDGPSGFDGTDGSDGLDGYDDGPAHDHVDNSVPVTDPAPTPEDDEAFGPDHAVPGHVGHTVDTSDSTPNGRGVAVYDTTRTSRSRRRPLPPAPATRKPRQEVERDAARRAELAAEQAARRGIPLPGSTPPHARTTNPTNSDGTSVTGKGSTT